MNMSELAGLLAPYIANELLRGVGSVFVPLTTPLTSTSWDGDSFSTTAKTLIDLSTVFGAPAGITAILAYVAVRDSGSAGTSCYIYLSPNDTAGQGMAANCSEVDDRYNAECLTVPCDANGDVYVQIVASGASTLDAIIQIHGYWI